MKGDKVMEKIALVTDAACNLPDECFSEYNIYRASMKIYFDNKEPIDQVAISHQEFYKKLIENPLILPRTTPPHTKDYLDIFNKLRDEGYTAAFCMPISAKMSTSLQAAKDAAAKVEDFDVTCVDTAQAGPAQGLFVYMVARELAKVQSKANLAGYIKLLQRKDPVFEVFYVESMHYLIANDRVGKARGFVGQLLNIKPLLTIEEGEIAPLNMAVGIQGLMNRVKEVSRNKIRNCKNPLVQVAWGSDAMQEKAEEVLKDMEKEGKTMEVLKSRLAPIIACHTGPATLSITITDKDFNYTYL